MDTNPHLLTRVWSCDPVAICDVLSRALLVAVEEMEHTELFEGLTMNSISLRPDRYPVDS